MEREKLAARLAVMRVFFSTGATREEGWRRRRLRALRDALDTHESELLAALHTDLGKSPQEAYVSEVGFVRSDISYALRHLHKWMRPQTRHSPLMLYPARSEIGPEPKGIALIVGPWNYPLQLVLSPLVSAIAAGNCAMIKPSEFAPATAQAIRQLIHDAFTPFPDTVSVVTGDATVARTLTELPFDHIFFTGSTEVGREVMNAAARRLTPVTLELGGKCPCIVCEDTDIPIAARRIVWGKFLNAGQTCVAPDYVLAHADIADHLLDEMVASVQAFYGTDPARSPDYGRIVNAHHFQRLLPYLEQGTPVCGGQHDAETLYIAPTILTDIDPVAPIMREEIFGPILPVFRYTHLDMAIAVMRSFPAPIALYVFARDSDTREAILSQVPSGGVCVNDTVSHIVAKELPFGGVGPSGMGYSRGKAGFDTFTHYRSVMRRATWLDLPMRYPPMRHSVKTLKRLMDILMRR